MSNQVETLEAVCKAKQEALTNELYDQAKMIYDWKGVVPVEWLRGVSETFARLSTRQAEIDMLRGMIVEVKKVAK